MAPPYGMHLFMLIVLLCLILPSLLHLLFMPPTFIRRSSSICPKLQPLQDELFFGEVPTELPNCAAIFDRNPEAIRQANRLRWCTRPDEITDSSYLKLTTNCKDFKTKAGYERVEVTRTEKAFPLAFSILMYEKVEQTERLLRAIYRPHNVYCIHVDKKSPSSVHKAMSAIAACLTNVFVVQKPVAVKWAEMSVLEADILCMKALLNHLVKWKYFINLTGREFPIRTNAELVDILTAYSGGNDVDGTFHNRPHHWTANVWTNENWMTSQKKDPVPANFLIAKGSAHVAVSRAFVDYAMNAPLAHKLLSWMKDIRAPDEHFFQTLNHNPTKNVPGAYTDNPDLKHFQTRLKIWQSKSEQCEGVWERFVCNWGSGDLYRFKAASELFVNKLKLEFDPVAFHCAEQWYYNRSMTTSINKIDMGFYENLPWVRRHLTPKKKLSWGM